jgi:DNA-binding PadR family transcriptional regulator
MMRRSPSHDSSRALYVLGMLCRGKAYGHELMTAVRVSRADRWVTLSEKHLYRVLEKLTRRGWITEVEERGRKLPQRGLFAITEAGRNALANLLRSQALREAFVPSPFDAAFGILAYSDVLTRDDVLGVLRARRDVLLQRHREDLAVTGPVPMEKLYGYLAKSLFDKAQRLLKVELRWLDDVINQVEHEDWQKLRVPDFDLESESENESSITRH